MDSRNVPTSLLMGTSSVPSPLSMKMVSGVTDSPQLSAIANSVIASPDLDAKSAESKRFIPEHKKQDAALTFPEKLMSLMKFSQEQDSDTFCVAWLSDGKSFVIRNPDEFTRQLLPKFFKATKFSSFTRKLYRWGFRQVNRGIGPDDPIIFGNEYFQRDNLELMAKMRSVTAASTRKQSNLQVMAQKRAFESMENEQQNKRALFDHLFMQQQQQNALGQSMFKNNGMNLAQALRPSNNGFHSFGGISAFDVLSQPMNNGNPLMGSFQQGGLSGLGNNPQNQAFPNAATTADIVNAAINALRFAP